MAWKLTSRCEIRVVWEVHQKLTTYEFSLKVIETYGAYVCTWHHGSHFLVFQNNVVVPNQSCESSTLFFYFNKFAWMLDMCVHMLYLSKWVSATGTCSFHLCLLPVSHGSHTWGQEWLLTIFHAKITLPVCRGFDRLNPVVFITPKCFPPTVHLVENVH